MGAEGGVCYLVVKDRADLEELQRLAGWLIDEVRHEGALSGHIRYRDPVGVFPVKGYPEAEVIEGAYGTDCEDSFQDLAEMCGRGVWPGSPFYGGDSPVGEYTFRELLKADERPKKWPGGLSWEPWWKGSVHTLLWRYLDRVPEEIKDMRIAAWASAVGCLILTTASEETWT